MELGKYIGDCGCDAERPRKNGPLCSDERMSTCLGVQVQVAKGLGFREGLLPCALHMNPWTRRGREVQWRAAESVSLIFISLIALEEC